MKKTIESGRRGFLKSVAFAAGAASQAEAQTPPTAPTKVPAEPAAAAPARPSVPYPRTFRNEHLNMIAFPLGGVGAGSVSLGGRGQLRDWEIFNRADKGRLVNYAFASIWAEAGGKPVTRVLEARLAPPYQAQSGLAPAQMSGVQRLESAVFTGEYPLATIAFRDRKLPVKVTLEAFTPFVPHDADGSGLPVAVLRYKVSNPGQSKAKVSIAWSMENPVGVDPRVRGGGGVNRGAVTTRKNEHRSGSAIEGLLMTNPATDAAAPMAGSMALALINAGDGKVSYLEGWPRAKWWASPLLFWDDFSADGALGPQTDERNAVGSICLQREIAPGKEADFTFLLAWHFPNRTPAWCGWSAPQGEENTVIGNHYCERFRDAWEAAEYAAANLAPLEKRMRQFMTAVRETTIPASVKEAAMANLSTLVTPTCFRTKDGKFRGFEGINDDRGCCHGNCTHVWNYETVTQQLFPTLARSMREAAFDLADRMNGVLPIRIALPEGKQSSGTTATDGTMGQIMKAYLDWQLSGDDGWLRGIWPKVKKSMQFSWVEGGWDGDKDGVSEGVQHNTYDVEFYGPNPMTGVYYLGGLRACEEMARAMNDDAFAGECRALFVKGSAWTDENLFNGRYYIQKTRGIPVEKTAVALRSRGGAENPEHPDFQLDEGCLADQLIGQFLADVAGLGPLLKPANMRKTLESIYKYNYRENLYEHDSMQRIYVLNDEATVLICDYGAATRPKVPFPYYSEAWTGIEYLYASQLLYAGMLREGVQCFENVRRRFDGERRNPWDEPECGHHYARAMSAWTGILALSGFQYHGPRQAVTAIPRTRGSNFASFWSTATGWGTFTRSVRDGRLQMALSVLYGKLPCRSVDLGAAAAGASTSAKVGAKALAHKVQRSGRNVVVALDESVELSEGDTLILSV